MPCGSYLQLQLQPLAKGGTGDTLASCSCMPDPQLVSSPVLSHDGNVGNNILYANGTIRTRPVKIFPLFLYMQSFPFFNPVQITEQEEVFSTCFLSLFMCLRHSKRRGPRRPLLRYRRSALFTLFLTDSPLQLLADLVPAMYHTFHLTASLSAHSPPTTLLCCHVYRYSTCQRLTCFQLQHHYLQLPQFFLLCYCFTPPSLLTCCSPSLLLRLS